MPPGHRDGGAPRRVMRALFAIFVVSVFAAATRPALATPPQEEPDERPSAGGRLSWVVDGDLDLVGDLWVDLPFRIDDRNSVFVSIDSRTTLEQPDGLTFKVRDLQYDLGVGWRGRPAWLHGPRLFALAGQRGKEAVDANGQPYVRYLGVGLESRDFRSFRASPRCATDGCKFGRRFDWNFLVGPVLEEREVQADLVIQGETGLWLAPLRGPGMALAFDLALDGLVQGSSLLADVSAGPRLSFAVAGGRRASFFLHYRSGGNPLGAEQPLWLLGFAYEEGRDAPPPGLGAPEIDGRVALGGGDGRISGQLRLRFLSPSFARGTRGVIVIDGNILTAQDTGDLYYFWNAGIEREQSIGIYGAYLHHRSNHQLAEPNLFVTSINVLELGYETLYWQRPAQRPRGNHGWGVLDGRVRAGFLLASSFGETTRWHLRGGLRWSLPVRGRAPLPYLLVEGDTGDVDRWLVAVGLAVLRNLELQVEYRTDEQYFAADQRAVLATARYWF